VYILCEYNVPITAVPYILYFDPPPCLPFTSCCRHHHRHVPLYTFIHTHTYIYNYFSNFYRPDTEIMFVWMTVTNRINPKINFKKQRSTVIIRLDEQTKLLLSLSLQCSLCNLTVVTCQYVYMGIFTFIRYMRNIVVYYFITTYIYNLQVD